MLNQAARRLFVCFVCVCACFLLIACGVDEIPLQDLSEQERAKAEQEIRQLFTSNMTTTDNLKNLAESASAVAPYLLGGPETREKAIDLVKTCKENISNPEKLEEFRKNIKKSVAQFSFTLPCCQASLSQIKSCIPQIVRTFVVGYQASCDSILSFFDRRNKGETSSFRPPSPPPCVAELKGCGIWEGMTQTKGERPTCQTPKG